LGDNLPSELKKEVESNFNEIVDKGYDPYAG
jgi:hypothetical protein